MNDRDSGFGIRDSERLVAAEALAPQPNPESRIPNPALLPLSRPYAARTGVPVLTRVDPAIFTRRYFAACLACTFCGDWCCRHGVDVDAENAARILAEGDALEALVGVPRAEWFDHSQDADDADMPGGRVTRTRVVDGACVFLNRRGRGCLLHAHALGAGRDYHDLKPIVSALFPLTFGGGALYVADEMEDDTLVCAGTGPVAYDAVRAELEYYFGAEFITELDEMRRSR